MHPAIQWDGIKGQVYFVNFAEFPPPNTEPTWRVVAGPLSCDETGTGNMQWRPDPPAPGMYRIGTEMP